MAEFVGVGAFMHFSKDITRIYELVSVVNNLQLRCILVYNCEYVHIYDHICVCVFTQIYALIICNLIIKH